MTSESRSPMLARDDQSPVINVASYLRDLYHLIAFLMADEKVASDSRFLELSEANYETEVNRLLVWIATATRQFLDMVRRDIGEEKCGRYWGSLSGDDGDAVDLGFRQACNIIIHAVEIRSYDRRVGYHQGTITIHGRGQGRPRRLNRALLDFGTFAKYCISLSKEVE